MRTAAGMLVLLALLVASCGSVDSVSPEERAAVISTQACGHASKTTGSGVIVGPGQVVTAAHVVVGASEVGVNVGGVEYAGTVVALDTGRDLAVLQVHGVERRDVEFTQLDSGDSGTIVEGASSGSVPAEILRRVAMTVDEVRGSDRSSRGGYELAAEIDGGDSGAGLFNNDGRLAAIVFAAPTSRDGIAWATRAEEIQAVLSADPISYVCDPAQSRLVPS